MDIHDLQLQRSRLVARLLEGHRRIEAAQARGQDVSSWEEFWISLLFEYEQLCQDEQAIQPTLFPLPNTERFER